MKKLYLIGGPMGVGKSTVSRILAGRLENSVFLDGDWCWNPEFGIITPQMKEMVTDNICHLLNNYINCPEYKNIIFCWVLHRQEIIDSIIGSIASESCKIINVSLLCSENVLIYRLSKDIRDGLRQPDVVGRALLRLKECSNPETIKINTDDITPERIADKIMLL